MNAEAVASDGIVLDADLVMDLHVAAVGVQNHTHTDSPDLQKFVFWHIDNLLYPIYGKMSIFLRDFCNFFKENGCVFLRDML